MELQVWRIKPFKGSGDIIRLASPKYIKIMYLVKESALDEGKVQDQFSSAAKNPDPEDLKSRT